uniref:ribonucleoside-diphosphate reductase n=1 Tax=viral metagenome TaxID=1070528 RepID=A0A6C0IEI8_9ZZZZ
MAFSTNNSMQVVKRDGRIEDVSFDKVLERIRKAADGLEVNSTRIAQRVIDQIYNGVKTTELDDLACQLAISLTTLHPDYGTLAAQIAVSNHQKNTDASFTKVITILANQVMPGTGEPICYVSQELVDCVAKHGAEIDAYIKHERDYLLDYFGFKTLEKSYLLRDARKRILERPQHLWMRTSLALWANDLPRAFETYDLMSKKMFTHATPTLFNAGTPRQQLSSCFLLAAHDDSIAGIYKSLADCAQISKHAGGIGLHVHNIRARGSLIRGTNGTSNGLIPMLRVFNNTARYVDQGGGRRNGSFAIYLEPWHADVEDFLKLKLNTGSEEERARDLFYALWISDLFMERVEADGEWSLFCPNEAPGLADVWGDEFNALYTRYEAEGRARKVVSAQKLWFQILDTQMETGTPYLLYKDAANRKSNQQNLGTIKCSNLCTEIIEYTSPEEQAVCNLASIGLPAFVKESLVTHNDGITYPEKVFDFDELRRVVRIAVRNLNRVIDINYYPTPETKRSNMRHRPIGLGVQGLADVFALLRVPWESPEAATLNQLIFEHMYYAALDASVEVAKVEGPYETFEGSPVSKNILQPDMWNVTPITETDKTLDWDTLRANIGVYGIRNSLLMAPMPTASTSQILGYNECFEPFTSNIYARRTLAGEFAVINKYLLRDLIKAGLWSENLKQKIISQNGSVQGIPEIPETLQNLYKTTWEIKMRTLIDLAAARGAFICQSQSLNLFVADATYSKLTSMHFYAWRKGLKTGLYYLRTKAPVMAQKFTVDPRLLVSTTPDVAAPVSVEETTADAKKRQRKELLDRLADEAAKAQCTTDNGEGCLLCSS